MDGDIFFKERYGLGFTSVRPLFSKQLQIPYVVYAVMLDCGMSLITMIQNHAKKKYKTFHQEHKIRLPYMHIEIVERIKWNIVNCIKSNVSKIVL